MSPQKRRETSSKLQKTSQERLSVETLSSPHEQGSHRQRNFVSQFSAICEEEQVSQMPVVEVAQPRGSDDLHLPRDEEPVPVIKIAFDHLDKQGDVQKAAIKGFQLEAALLQAIGKSLIMFPTISALRLEACGLTTDQLPAVADLLTRTATLKDLSLDFNRFPGGDFAPLLDPRGRLEYLSLRYCGVSDGGARSLAGALAYQEPETSTLLVLNLTCNSITCEGAQHFAQALRTNRTLVCLLLAGNRIGDDGASSLAESLQKFPLTHCEAKIRRRRNVERLIQQRAIAEQQATIKAGRSAQRLQGNVLGSTSSRRESLSGKDLRRVEKQTGSEASVAQPADRHPLVQEVLAEEGQLWCSGNRTLAHLSLAYNHVGCTGVKSLLSVVKYQDNVAAPQHMGLPRLTLEGNPVPESCEELTRLTETMSQSHFSITMPSSQFLHNPVVKNY